MTVIARMAKTRWYSGSVAALVTIFQISAHAAAIDVGKLPTPATRQVDFGKDIQPIFRAHCLGCHGPKKQEAEFRLYAKEIALKGGELGPAIVPGNSAESLVCQL